MVDQLYRPFNRYLASFPANALNQRNAEGDLPLHIALKKSEPESVIICELLNKFPGSAKEKDSNGDLPLFLACRNPKTSYGIVRLLLRYSNKSMSSFAHVLTLYPDSIYPQASKIKVYGSLPLHALFYANNTSVDIVRMLLSLNPEAARTSNFHGSIPLHYICANPSMTVAHWDIIRMLLSRYREGAVHPNKEGETPLSRALTAWSDSFIFTELLHHGGGDEGDENEDGGGQEASSAKYQRNIIRDLLNSAGESASLTSAQRALRGDLNWQGRRLVVLCSARMEMNGCEKQSHEGWERIYSLVFYKDVWRRIIGYL